MNFFFRQKMLGKLTCVLVHVSWHQLKHCHLYCGKTLFYACSNLRPLFSLQVSLRLFSSSLSESFRAGFQF